MTNPSVSVKPPFGSVQQRIQRFRQVAAEGKDLLDPMLGSLEAVVDDDRWTDTEKVVKIRNLVVALDFVRAERAPEPSPDPTGLSYTRADDGPDDPTPVSGARIAPHTGGMTDGGLVDETDGPVIHVWLVGAATACGLTVATLPARHSYVPSWSDPSTCPACADEAPF